MSFSNAIGRTAVTLSVAIVAVALIIVGAELHRHTRGMNMETGVMSGLYDLTSVGRGFDRQTGEPVYWLIGEKIVEENISPIDGDIFIAPVHTSQYRFFVVPEKDLPELQDKIAMLRDLPDLPFIRVARDGKITLDERW